MPEGKEVIFFTAYPETVIVITNSIGNVKLNNQWLVVELDQSSMECTDVEGPFHFEAAFCCAEERQQQIRIIASALPPDDKW